MLVRLVRRLHAGSERSSAAADRYPQGRAWYRPVRRLVLFIPLTSALLILAPLLGVQRGAKADHPGLTLASGRCGNGGRHRPFYSEPVAGFLLRPRFGRSICFGSDGGVSP